MSLPTGPWGAWSSGLRLRERAAAVEAAAALEEAGCSALWMTGGLSDPFERVADLLGATSRVTVATGILSIWTMSPDDVATGVRSLPDSDRHRFLLGLGVSHAQLVDRGAAGRYRRPLTQLRTYLDGLDATGPVTVGRHSRVLAALGPKMLELAATRAAGAHPYLTTVDHTADARRILGPDAFLAPTQMVVLDANPDTARAVARRHLAMYLGQPNYVNSWLRLGFTEDDAADGGSDRLVDALVMWGDPERVAARLREHLAAGADHVAVQMLDREAGWQEQPLPVADWQRLFTALH
ncbi:TIGR03620 family F420-dependent LLM class oxidoreductase [Nocardioides sp. LMS-CY]|uniref:TIGR03620 family F420-dependent LLM class oxidoreductase n=1 Tax=Nocardioides sp. (strain LMS-CY) TaxID=2840457 RepID=UPI001C008CEC|nr:TIGR03620 family F420-dependent LLM class oxidoreductase [Nocardioides sp. LMS-CY]QWF22795.1 TIGR03620 family F420-dependent LLM class oxidoreductase [Nocardioides sp. LMS-CY]